MTALLESSKQIIDKAIADYKPYAIIVMLSGGDDSMTALAVAKYLNVPITHIMHGVTGTGIQETYDFVREVVSKENAIYLEANAGNAYKDYVLRKGFFGIGEVAHKFSYHVLKSGPFRKACSAGIRQGQRNRNILFINGARRLESEVRKKTMINPIKLDHTQPRNIWVNIVNEWDKTDCLNIMEYLGVKRNPVSVKICRSGECFCGTMQSKADRIEASLIYPDWGKWVNGIEKAVKEKGFNWGWGENMPKSNPKQIALPFDEPQFMCTGCKVNYEKQLPA